MQQPKLVIASVLKPVDDTRMFEKFALSISQTTKYEINIIGFASKKLPRAHRIKFHGIFDFERVSISRFMAPFTYYRKLKEIKPESVVICTHELLLPSVLYKLIYKAKLVYDIRENYFYNIKYLPSWPIIFRHALAYWVRAKEWMTAGFVDHFILAEKVYFKQLKFIGKRYSLLENKASDQLKKYKNYTINNSPLRTLIFTGTIAKSTGVYEVLELFEIFKKSEPSLSLKLVGHCPSKDELDKLLFNIKSYRDIVLIGGHNLVPHDVIIDAILEADCGYISYPNNRATEGKIPTKFFEYVALGLPIITKHKHLIKYANRLNHPVMNASDPVKFTELITTGESSKNKTCDDVFWSSQEHLLLSILKS